MLTNLGATIGDLRKDLPLFRKCARNTYRMMSIYHEGGDMIDASCAPWIVKQYSAAHRRISLKQLEETYTKWRKIKGLDEIY